MIFDKHPNNSSSTHRHSAVNGAKNTRTSHTHSQSTRFSHNVKIGDIEEYIDEIWQEDEPKWNDDTNH